jgi:hypothetical protein
MDKVGVRWQVRGGRACCDVATRVTIKMGGKKVPAKAAKDTQHHRILSSTYTPGPPITERE